MCVSPVNTVWNGIVLHWCDNVKHASYERFFYKIFNILLVSLFFEMHLRAVTVRFGCLFSECICHFSA